MNTSTLRSFLFFAGTMGLLLQTAGMAMVPHARAAGATAECTAHYTTVISDTTDTVDGGASAVKTYDGNPWWTAYIPRANWIWKTELVEQPEQGETVTFTKTFTIPGFVSAARITMAADNFYTISLNGTQIGAEQKYEENFMLETQHTYSVAGTLMPGQNTLTIAVTNKGVEGSDAYSNPAGLLYRLQALTYECGAMNDLQLTAVCTYPDGGTKWRVRNDRNPFNVPFTWEVYPGQETGGPLSAVRKAVGSSGDTYFTSTLSGAAKIYWRDGHGQTQSVTRNAAVAACRERA